MCKYIFKKYCCQVILCWREEVKRARDGDALLKLWPCVLHIIYLCAKIVKKSNYTICIYFDR